MKKAVVLAMAAPLIAGPATFALAATPSPVNPLAPQGPSTSTQVQPASSGATTGSPATGSSSGQTSQTQQTVVTPAPPADSSAKALDVAGVVGVGETQAHAGSDGASGTGNAITLGGKTLAGGTAGQTGQNGTTGGTATGNQTSSGALIDTGTTPLGQIAVAPWSAKSAESNGTNTAHAEAGLAHVNLGGASGLDLKVLYSTSDASYTAGQSQSSSSSDGVLLNAGGGALIIDLLHADTSSSGKGSSYLASVNGNQIGSNSQVNGQCQIPIPSVLTINCLSASGGSGTSPASAFVGTITGQGSFSALPTGTVAGTTATGSTTPAASVQPNVAPQQPPSNQPPSGQPSGQPAAATASAAQTLPFTGLNAAMLATLGGLLAGTGVLARRLGRRSRARA